MACERLGADTFRCVVTHTPLVSVDLLLFEGGRVLLGMRRNRPAQGYWFTLGGRVCKNEPIAEAIRRIAREETGREITGEPEFVGVFEHIYDDGIFEGVGTHYLNLAYRLEAPGLKDLPEDQHDRYRWFGVEELMAHPRVHPYVKDYFTQKKGTVPQ